MREMTQIMIIKQKRLTLLDNIGQGMYVANMLSKLTKVFFIQG